MPSRIRRCTWSFSAYSAWSSLGERADQHDGLIDVPPGGGSDSEDGCDHDKYRRLLWQRGIKPVIARRGTPHGSGLGAQRYMVERTIGLLHWFRRLRILWENRDDIHEAFLLLAAALICWRRLARTLLGPLSGDKSSDVRLFG